MSDEEIRLKCLELTTSTKVNYGLDKWLIHSKKVYDFVYGKSDAKLDALVASTKSDIN